MDKKVHQDFLSNLPDLPLKKVIIYILILLIIGFCLSLISITIALILTKVSLLKGSNFDFSIGILAQDLPIAILAFILFYKLNIKKVSLQLNPKRVSRSPLLFFGAIFFIFIIGLIMNLATFATNKDPNSWKFLLNYVNKGVDKITPSYIYLYLTSFIAMLILGIFEEFIFRFTIYRFLRKHGIFLALILSSILFSLIHGNVNISIIIFSIIISLYYEYSNNFLGVVLIHVINNQLMVFYVNYLTYLILR